MLQMNDKYREQWGISPYKAHLAAFCDNITAYAKKIYKQLGDKAFYN